MSADCRIHFRSAADAPLAFRSGRPISLGRFRTDVYRLIEALGQEANILVTCTGRYGFSVALLAAWLSDKATLLPPNQHDPTLRAIREQYPIAYECNDRWAERLTRERDDMSHSTWTVELGPQNTAVRLFTSGSTGAPVVVTKSISNLVEEAKMLADTCPWPSGAVVGSVAPQHMYGLTFTIMLPWIAQLPWVDESPRFSQDLVEILTATDAGTLISVPAQYRALLEDRTDLAGINCVSAAAPLPSDTAAAWRRSHDRDILEIYGSTETGVVAYRYGCDSERWQAFPRVDLSTNRGLLHVRSAFVGDQWPSGFQTADRVNLDVDKRFQLLGRADSIIKIAGKRISLMSIERCLLSCPGVTDAVAIAVPTPGRVRDMAIWAAVAGKAADDLNEASIKAVLRTKLDGIEIPRRIAVIERIPRNHNGKLPREAVLGLFRTTEQQGV